MSSMGNLEKLGILVIVILVVVVGVVAITPTDNAPDVLGADVARPAGEVAPLDPVAGDVTNGAFPADGTGAAPGTSGTSGVAGAPADWPVVPGTPGAKKDTMSADLGASGTAAGAPSGTPSGVDPLAPVTTAPATYKEVKVGKNETLAIIAKRELGQSTRWPEIVALNPGLDPKRMKTGITIKVPLKDGAVASAPVAPVTPAGTPGTTTTPVVDSTLPPAPKVDTPAPVAEKTYTVQSGDTLSDIARRQLGSASKVGELKAANADVLKGSDAIRSGMKLRIPGTSSSTTTASAPRTTTSPAVEVSATGGSTYTVQAGDTLSSIASRFLGSSSRYKEIIAANEPVLHGSDKLKIGMKLSIPSNVSAK